MALSESEKIVCYNICARWVEDGRCIMSKSAQLNSRKEDTRGASREEHARQDVRDGAARRESQENRVRSKTRRRKSRRESRTIRARCDALRGLSDDELLSGLERLHGDERAALLDILLYFIEIKRRRLYVPMGYGSLFEFCVDRYRYSRTTAWRRVSVARCIERFPCVAEMFLTGELNLCAISMISGILTKENAGEILSRVEGKPIKDIEMLVARYRPAKVIRDRIKPVFVMNPDTGIGSGGGSAGAESTSPPGTTPGCGNAPSGGDNANPSFNIETERKAGLTSALGAESGTQAAGRDAHGSCAAAEPERVVVTKKFKVEFAVEPKFIKKLDKIKVLLSPKFPKGLGFEQVIDILMDEYLDRHSPESKMKKRARRGDNKKKRSIAKGTDARNNKPVGDDQDTGYGNHVETRKTGKKRGGAERTRHIPQSTRDEVFVRDGGRCSFTTENGKRCEETWNLEIDHITPYARGGDNSPKNLRLLCPTHNRLAAEKEYGSDHMKKFYRRE